MVMPGSLEDVVGQALSEIGGIGRRPDGGYDRFSFTAEDLELRRWFTAQAEVREMVAEVDRNANLWAWWGEPGPGAVVTGSHLDSVPAGGGFDGPLGVVSAFLAVDLLRASAGPRPRPVAVVAFVEEEGARFGVACLGSRLLTGACSPDAARALTDPDGTTLADAMRHAGADPGALGPDEDRLAQIGAFVELHVEQGRGLAALGAPVGVATAIWPHGRWRLHFAGEANHAGTTALADRRDPLLPLAVAVGAARECAETAGAHATVGRVEVDPNGANVVASSADAWLDVRAPADATVDSVVSRVAERVGAVAVEHKVRFEIDPVSRTPGIAFDPGLVERISTLLGGVPRLATAAGHDAGILAARVPATMLFVRNPSGVSHSPGEHADLADGAEGVRALAAVLGDLAAEPVR